MSQAEVKPGVHPPSHNSGYIPDKVKTEQYESTNGVAMASGVPVLDRAEEKRIIRKMDLRIIPMVTTLYLLSFIDRG